MKAKALLAAKTVSFIILFMNSNLLSGAEEVSNKPEPEKIAVPYYLKGQSTLVPLTKVIGKDKGPGIFLTPGEKIKIEIKGKTSDVKITNDPKPSFVIALPGGDITRLFLFRLKVKGENRIAEVGRLKGFGGGSTPEKPLALEISRWNPDSYKVTPSLELQSGEYGFTIADSVDFFCFTFP